MFYLRANPVARKCLNVSWFSNSRQGIVRDSCSMMERVLVLSFSVVGSPGSDDVQFSPVDQFAVILATESTHRFRKLCSFGSPEEEFVGCPTSPSRLRQKTLVYEEVRIRQSRVGASPVVACSAAGRGSKMPSTHDDNAQFHREKNIRGSSACFYKEALDWIIDINRSRCDERVLIAHHVTIGTFRSQLRRRFAVGQTTKMPPNLKFSLTLIDI